MKKLIKIGGIFIVAGLLVLFIAWAKSGFGLNVSSFKQLDQINLQAEKTQQLSQFKSINIDTNAHVNLKTGNNFKIVSKTRKGVTINSHLENDQLNVTQTGHNDNTNHFGIVMINGNWNNVTGDVTIYVPSGWKLSRINQTSQNDSLTLAHLTINDGLTLHGDVDLNHVKAHYLNASAETGDVSVTDSQFEHGQSNVHASSGDVEINNARFDKLTKIENDSGDADITKLQVTNGSTSITSDSGDVTIHDSKFNTLKLASENGDVDFKALDIKDDLNVTNDNGDIEGKLMAGDRAHIKTTNDSGDVDVKKSLNDPHAKKQYSFSNSNGDIDIE